VIPLRDDAPVERTPVVTCALLLANLLAFLWQVDLPALPRALARGELAAVAEAHLQESVQRGGAIPYEILTLEDVERRDLVPPPLTVLTAMFLHGGVLHLAFNLLFLWIFGNNVEDALGRRRFLLLYLACGVAAALLHVATAALTGTLLSPLVGASGAVAGVLGAYLVLLPRARVLTFVPVLLRAVPLPASLFIGGWFALQVLSVIFSSNTGVAFLAHVGGFVAGLFLARVLSRRRGWPGPGAAG
jgi:membrane associated rhomboid family serine protease